MLSVVAHLRKYFANCKTWGEPDENVCLEDSLVSFLHFRIVREVT